MPYATRDFLAAPMGLMDENIIIPHHAGIGADQRSARIHELCLARSRYRATK